MLHFDRWYDGFPVKWRYFPSPFYDDDIAVTGEKTVTTHQELLLSFSEKPRPDKVVVNIQHGQVFILAWTPIFLSCPDCSFLKVAMTYFNNQEPISFKPRLVVNKFGDVRCQIVYF